MTEPVILNRANLDQLPPGVARPGYDLAALRSGIVHLGLGGFHRAHMARYTHALMQTDPAALEWGIAGAGLLPADRRMTEALAPQDNLYVLVERQGDREQVGVIGSLSQVIFAGEDSAALLAAIDDPAIRIVSLTVTEHGYCLNRSTKQLDPDHPAIVHDLADPQSPKSAIGVIVEAYRRRRDGGGRAFTAMTCDNIQHNGEVLRQAVLALARLREPALAEWITANAAFPNTMVDRITPVTTEADITELAERHGVADRWPVFSELFTQWVIEDDFVDGRPRWEEVGAQFVPDVAPYEYMKLRLLNASHLAIAGIGQLAGVTHVSEAMRTAPIEAYMRALMDRETGPTLPPVPGIDLAAYKNELVARFANPRIQDTLQRINTDAPLNVLVDPLRDRIRAGRSYDLLALALAAWIRRMRGTDEAGRPVTVVHPLAEQLRERALAGGEDPRPVLGLTTLFGELGEDEALVDRLRFWLGRLDAIGALRSAQMALETAA